jgi:hypothetical protein
LDKKAKSSADVFRGKKKSAKQTKMKKKNLRNEYTDEESTQCII